jgi:putative transposase
MMDMPRTARITMENACYHVITRGNQKQLVFIEPQDYEKYLFLLAKYKKRYKFRLYCFCLMPNHVHLLIEVQNPLKLNKIMRGLNLSYTLHYNSKYEKVGHLWQDRFKSKIIEKDAYLLECINYIEANPLRASLVSDITKYRWSSYVFRMAGINLLDNLFSF